MCFFYLLQKLFLSDVTGTHWIYIDPIKITKLSSKMKKEPWMHHQERAVEKCPLLNKPVQQSNTNNNIMQQNGANQQNIFQNSANGAGENVMKNIQRFNQYQSFTTKKYALYLALFDSMIVLCVIYLICSSCCGRATTTTKIQQNWQGRIKRKKKKRKKNCLQKYWSLLLVSVIVIHIAFVFLVLVSHQEHERAPEGKIRILTPRQDALLITKNTESRNDRRRKAGRTTTARSARADR